MRTRDWEVEIQDLQEALAASQREVERLERNRVALCAVLDEWLSWGLKKPHDIIQTTQAILSSNKGPSPAALREGSE